MDTSLSREWLGRESIRIDNHRCSPLMIVSDNGVWMTSNVILAWQEKQSLLRHCIAPGKQQNGFIARASTAGCVMNASTSICSAILPRLPGHQASMA